MASKFDLNDFIMHHIGDSYEWHIPLLAPIHLPGFLTVHMLMLMIGTAFLFILMLVVYRKQDRVPTGITNFIEFFVVYIRDEIAIPNMGQEEGEKFTPLFCSFFFFILICNLMGLIPVFSTATGNINLTAGLAFLVFILMVGGTFVRGVMKGGIGGGFVGMWHALIPAGIPGWFVPIMFVIEVFLLFVRCVALAMRLFANMIAGHIVITAFLGLCILFGVFAGILAFPMAVVFYCMEIFVCLLQAFIFVLLSAIFIGHMYHPKH
jgi:F-type H+-transporting ATPase subunit a